jgi:hypothetical protein
MDFQPPKSSKSLDSINGYTTIYKQADLSEILTNLDEQSKLKLTHAKMT